MRKAYVWSIAKLNSLNGWGRIGILASAAWTIGVCVVIVAEFSNDSLGPGDQRRTFTKWIAAGAPAKATAARNIFDQFDPPAPSAKPKADWEPASQVAKNDSGQFVALMGDAWVPVDHVAKNDAGQYVVIRRKSLAEGKPWEDYAETPGVKPAWMSGKIIEPRPGELSDAQVFGSVSANWLSIFLVMLAPMAGMWGGAIFLVRATGWVIAGFRRNKAPPSV